MDVCFERFGLPDIVINEAAGNFISQTARLSPNNWQTIVDIGHSVKWHCICNLRHWQTLDKGKKSLQFFSHYGITAVYAETGSGFVVLQLLPKQVWRQ